MSLNNLFSPEPTQIWKYTLKQNTSQLQQKIENVISGKNILKPTYSKDVFLNIQQTYSLMTCS